LKIACVAIVKNEERHIAEWLGWQFLAGFDTVLLYDNASTDRTVEVARGLAARFDIRIVDWPASTPDYQGLAYTHAARSLAGQYDWVAFFDTDEFLVLDDGLNLKTLLAGRPEPAVGVHWAIFGSSGHHTMPGGWVTTAFLHRSGPEFAPNRHFKSIIRPERMLRYYNPHAFDCGADIVTLSGRRLNQEMPGYVADAPDYTLGRLHHYFTRSRAQWEAKLARGYPDVTRAMSDFEAYDRNEVFDDQAASRQPAARALLCPAGTPKHRFVSVTCARWEERTITEWLNYMRAIGFDHVYLYCNDNDPAELYAKVLPFTLGPAPFVTFHHHPVQGDQTGMYAHFLRNYLAEAEWVGFFDVDEFLRLPAGERIGQFMARFPPAVDSVLFNWVFFGPNGHKTPPEGHVLAHYTRRNAHVHSHTKHLSRAAVIQGEKPFDPGAGNGFWHALVSHVDVPVHVVNVLGEDAQHYHSWTDQERETYINAPARREQIFGTAVIHHYAFRSEAAFITRAERGLGGNFYGQVMWREVAEGPNFAGYLNWYNAVEDTRLAGFWPQLLGAAWNDQVAAATEANQESGMKCAVVLVVKDEASDIAAWLAWYQVLGFDTCIVFDDHSTDGTWEILNAAATRQDIRLYRTEGDLAAYHEPRQSACYQAALHFYKDEFDWLGFFDADEYLWLAQDETIKDFLARFPNADQVCVNWCVYGSSGHYLKPTVHPVEAYTWHGDAQQPINRHVKSLVRPKHVGPHYVCVHCFDVPVERSVLANGKPVVWSEQVGLIAEDPDWSVAKVMHYQCRSMEHFLERLRKYEQCRNRPGLWDGYDVKQVQDLAPVPLARRAAAIAYQRPGVVQDLIFDIGMSEGNDTAFYLAKGFRVVGVEPDVQMFYALQARFAPEIAGGRLVLHNAAAAAKAGEIVEFFHHEQAQGISGLSHTRPEFATGYKSYHVLTTDWPTLTEKHGVPHYAKIDIEGHEAAFLGGAKGRSPLPDFCSVECYKLAPAEALYELGYRRFKLIDQNPPGGVALPQVQKEGRAIEWPAFHHASGPFGRDLGGEWVDFEAFKTLWAAAERELHRTWFDCHAWMG